MPAPVQELFVLISCILVFSAWCALKDEGAQRARPFMRGRRAACAVMTRERQLAVLAAGSCICEGGHRDIETAACVDVCVGDGQCA